MKKGGGSESTIIVSPSKFVLVYALHSLEYILGLARFRVFVLKLLYIKKANLKMYISLSGIDCLVKNLFLLKPSAFLLFQNSLSNRCAFDWFF